MERDKIKTTLNSLLKKVEKPGRYIGGEINQYYKNPDSVKLRFAFAFPDKYEIGMSSCGMQILYTALNEQDDIYCERVFAPDSDMEQLMREYDIPLFSCETKSDLKEFDIIGFTLQYEMSFTNIINMLELAQIPLLSKDRADTYPILVAGGPCAFNPEPMADFFDIFIIGDGEELIVEISKLKAECANKEEFLAKASKLDGIYVPAYYEVEYKSDGTIQKYIKTNEEAPDTIKRYILKNLDTAIYPEKPLVPLIETVQDRAVVETFRGCTRGCRFCQAGMIYRPIRERSYETIMHLVDAQLKATGHEELSLLSLSTSDYSQFRELVLSLMEKCSAADVALSLPSMRLDAFSFEVLESIQKYRKTGLTFAPEAGTQRLRDVINKNITEDDIYSAMRQAIQLGWKKVKLYFMMGLPSETDEDLLGIPAIAKKIIDINYELMGNKGGRFNVNVSVSNFVPKAHTPFQWESQDRDFYEKHMLLRDAMKKVKGANFSYHDSFISTLEGMFARGDRRLSALLIAAHEHGCKFDTWSEHFNEEAWRAAIQETNTDIAFYTTRERSEDEVFPWDIIDCGVTKAFLLSERHKAYQGITTHDCRESCVACGMSKYTDCAKKVNK